jgi:hypothetical protein
MRGGVFTADVANAAQLRNAVRRQLEQTAGPWLTLVVDVMDVGNAFAYCRLGNAVWLQASELRLPGGRRGWRGTARILVMAYNEGQRTVTLSLKAPYRPGEPAETSQIVGKQYG